MDRRTDETPTTAWLQRLQDEAGISTPNSLIGILVVIILVIIIIQLL